MNHYEYGEEVSVLTQEVATIIIQWVAETTNTHQTALISWNNSYLNGFVDALTSEGYSPTEIARIFIDENGQVVDNEELI